MKIKILIIGVIIVLFFGMWIIIDNIDKIRNTINDEFVNETQTTEKNLEFEILVDKSNDVKKEKILNSKDLNLNDEEYNLYYYGLSSVNIKIDENILPLEQALINGKISLEDIINKANKDLKDETITGDMYKDGGSIEYNYNDYTIIKCNNIIVDPNTKEYIINKDIYIGISGLKLSDLDI